ncbi:hypothetical protein RZS08_15610, partial [Arthrospira platensis SPKY1]|nr:hypothetical protein [Arthrospira platensis SPKY1]
MPAQAILDTLPLVFMENRDHQIHLFPDLYPFMSNFTIGSTPKLSSLVQTQSIFVYATESAKKRYAGGAYSAATESVRFSTYLPGNFELYVDSEPPTASRPARYTRKRDGKRLP